MKLHSNDQTQDSRMCCVCAAYVTNSYNFHQYTETHHDPYTHTVKMTDTLCRDPELLESDQIMELCKQLKLRGEVYF